MKVPDYTDTFGDRAKLSVDLLSAAQFLVYDENTHKITITDPDTSNLAEGSFKIKLVLTDSLQKTVERAIKIVVTCFKGYYVEKSVQATPFEP